MGRPPASRLIGGQVEGQRAPRATGAALDWKHRETDAGLAHALLLTLPPTERSGWAVRGQRDAWQQLQNKNWPRGGNGPSPSQAALSG